MKGMGKRGGLTLASMTPLTCKPCTTSALCKYFSIPLTPSFSYAFYL